MTDSQIIAIAIIFVAAMGSILYNNSRITDVGKRIDDLRNDLSTRLTDARESLRQHIDDKHKLLDTKLDRIIDMLASHDERISRLEGRR